MLNLRMISADKGKYRLSMQQYMQFYNIQQNNVGMFVSRALTQKVNTQAEKFFEEVKKLRELNLRCEGGSTTVAKVNNYIVKNSSDKREAFDQNYSSKSK